MSGEHGGALPGVPAAAIVFHSGAAAAACFLGLRSTPVPSLYCASREGSQPPGAGATRGRCRLLVGPPWGASLELGPLVAPSVLRHVSSRLVVGSPAV